MSDETTDTPPPRRKLSPRFTRFICGLIVGLTLFGVGWMYVVNRSFSTPKEVRTLWTSQGIIRAVESYRTEFGQLPVPDSVIPEKGGSLLVTDQPAGIAFLRILNGENPRNAPFLKVKEGQSRKDGLMYSKDNTIEGLYDVWGNPFRIVIDTQGDGVLVAKRGDETEMVRGEPCIVFTAGKDRKLGTWDDYRSWVPGLPPRSRWSWQYVKSLLP